MSEEQAQQMLQQMQMLENMYTELSQKENSIKNINSISIIIDYN